MLIVGSQALASQNIMQEFRKPRDTDIICTFEEFQIQADKIKRDIGIKRCVPLSANKFHIRDNNDWNWEFEIAWPGSSGEYLLEHYQGVAPLHVLYALKMSHRYLRNSPHFLKTMRDIQHMRKFIARKDERLVFSEWFKQREEETYTYSHPKLNVEKKDFFDDSVGYKYDHDTIHQTVALMEERARCTSSDGAPSSYLVKMPAYTLYMQDGAQVMTDKEKFFAVEEKIRLYGVYEEACVLALERSQIPFAHVDDDLWFFDERSNPTPRQSFEMALMKVCTSITSGWFREYAWENYDRVLQLYAQWGEWDYISRFRKNKHLLKPFKAV